MGTRRSFFEGLLAVALATPCSAPFLGTAVGFAFASPGAAVIAVFVAIGLGLAAPFAAICAFPQARAFLPRPGPGWCELRSALGFALLATVVWLVWVLGRSAGVDAVAALLALLLAVSLVAAWTHARLERRDAARPRARLGARPRRARLELDRASCRRPPARPRTSAAWSPEEVARLRAEGRSVVVVFTADWCLTCKWNERTVLDQRAGRGTRSRGAASRCWSRTGRGATRRSAASSRASAGPACRSTLVYHAGAAEPQVLPELLTVEGVLAALEGGEGRHAQEARAADAS